jgi:hypothetical protein
MMRSDAYTFLDGEFRELAVEAQWDGLTTTAVYNGAIDNAWRQLGVLEASLQTTVLDDSNIFPVQALLSYYALQRFWRAFSLRVDVNIAGSISATRSQLTATVKQMLQQAQVEANGYGFYVGGDNFQMGRVTLDYLEPDGAEFSAGNVLGNGF